MGRRSLHSPEELRQIILEAARTIIETDGLAGISAREIARLIGYSPGTLYNIFENLDDLLLTLQVQLLDQVVGAMRAVPVTVPAAKHVDDLGKTFLDFALANKQMWNLLLAHYPSEAVTIPQALHDRVNELVGIISGALTPIMKGAAQQDIDLAARSLWGGVQGLTAIAVTAKGPTMSAGNAHTYVQTLTSTFVKGLAR